MEEGRGLDEDKGRSRHPTEIVMVDGDGILAPPPEGEDGGKPELQLAGEPAGKGKRDTVEAPSGLKDSLPAPCDAADIRLPMAPLGALEERNGFRRDSLIVVPVPRALKTSERGRLMEPIRREDDEGTPSSS